MRDDFPRVPTMMGVEDLKDPDAEDTFERIGLIFVTCSISDAKSKAARWTPGHSSEERNMGAAFPLLTMGKVEGDGWNATQLLWPIATTEGKKTLSPRMIPALSIA